MDRKRTRVVISLMAILALVLVSAAGCGGAPDPEVANGEPSEPEATEPEKTEPEEPKEPEEETKEDDEPPAEEVFRLGDTVTREKYDITLTALNWVWEDGPDRPDEGKRWLQAFFTIDSRSKDEFSVSRLVNFQLYDEDGNTHNSRLLATMATYDTWLEDGQTHDIDVVFIVDEDDTKWELTFNPDHLVFPSLRLGRSSFEIRIEDVED